jgi:type VI secretion system secreted protein VgrG
MDSDAQSNADSAFQRLWFETSGASLQNVHVESIEGREAISKPYHFEVVLVSNDALRAVDFVGKRAKLGIDVGGNSLVANGMVLEFQTEDPNAIGSFIYRIVLVPALKFLEFNTQNQIYGTETPVALPDIIQMALDGGLVKQSSRSGGRQASIKGEQRLTGTYPSRDHVVQYQESDLAFLSRSCEHAGVFFFFEQSDSGETVVFGDSNVAFSVAKLPSGGLSYHRRAMANTEAAVVTSLRCVERALPERIYLSEYNDLLPSVELLAQADVVSDGFGLVVEYGQNFLTPEEGNTLATVRAQEIACRGRVIQGESTAPQLRPGFIFQVSGHPDSEMDDRYVVVEVTHKVAIPSTLGRDSGVEYKDYGNAFLAIPFSVPFRPQRVTARPIAHGLFGGTIDGSGDGSRAELDQYGRYKVRVFYDDGNSPDGSATEYIRKAQPYAGANDSGMHFPLLKGTEVALGYVNGDPDRPIILGALPNPLTPNVVSSANQTRNRISSTTNVLFEIDDGPSGGGAPSGGGPGGMGLQNHYAMEAPAGQLAGEGSAAPDAAHALPLQDHHLAGGSDFSSAKNYARISVPGSAHSYLRLGVEADTDSTTWTTGLSTQLTTPTSTTGQPVTTSDGLYNSKPDTVHTGDGFANGVLLGTKNDLVVNVTGGNVNQIGTGVTTQVTTNDHFTDVKAGAFMVNAANGIYMTAGPDGSGGETNIVLTASGYVKTKTEGDQHVYSSSNSYTYIKGDKFQDIQGNNVSTVEGNNVSSIAGTHTSTIVGASTSMLVGEETAVKVGARVTSNIGIGLAINLSLDAKIIFGGEISYALPFALKMVTGFDFKVVWGTDIKFVTTDVKFVTAARYELQPAVSTMTAGWAADLTSLVTVLNDVASESKLMRIGSSAVDLVDSAVQIMASDNIQAV